MTRGLLLACAAGAAMTLSQTAFADDFDTRDLSLQQNTVTSVQCPHSGALKVVGWVDHEANTYKLGETVRLFVKANKDAYLSVLSIGPSGNAVQLYPSSVQPAAQLKAGATLEIPGKNAGASIVASGKPGFELISIVASESPIELVGADKLSGDGAFKSVDGGADSFARDLQLMQVPQAAEVSCYNKIIKTIGPAPAADAGSNVVVVSTPVPAAEPPAERPPLLLAIDRKSYKPGDLVTMSVTTLEACYLWVVDVTADHSARLLFPNQVVQDNHVAANSTALLSGPGSQVKILASAPAGKDAVFALCGQQATPPWQGGVDFSQMFSTIDASKGLARALVVAGPDAPQTAEIPPEYTWTSALLTVAE